MRVYLLAAAAPLPTFPAAPTDILVPCDHKETESKKR